MTDTVTPRKPVSRFTNAAKIAELESQLKILGANQRQIVDHLNAEDDVSLRICSRFWGEDDSEQSG